MFSSVRAESCIAARCVFCVAGCILACFIGACYQRALHACCIVSSVHRKRAALAMAHRRVARRAQSDGGGVLSMTKATALFDTVAISGTDGWVRAGRGGDARRGGCVVEPVSADGVRRPVAIGVAAPAVRRTAAAWLPWTMGPSRSRAARSRTARRCVHPARVARPHRGMVCCALRHGR